MKIPLPNDNSQSFSRRISKQTKDFLVEGKRQPPLKRCSIKKGGILAGVLAVCVVCSAAFFWKEDQQVCAIPTKEYVFIESVKTSVPLFVYITTTPRFIYVTPTPAPKKRKNVSCCSITKVEFFNGIDQVRNYNLDYDFSSRLSKYAQAVWITTGEKLYIDSLFRTYKDQVAVKKAKGKLAANPGHSRHEFGLAADLSAEQIKRAEKANITLEQFGLWLPMGDPERKKQGRIFEDWHVEKLPKNQIEREDSGVEILMD